MVLEYLANIDAIFVLVAFIIFVIFILSIKHVIKTTQNFTNMILKKLRTLAIVVIAAIIFPIVGDRLLGLSITADLPTIKIFALGGIALYALYLLGSGIYKGLSFAEKKMPSLPKKDRKFDKIMKMEKDKGKKIDELEKKINEGKKKLKDEMISDGDTVKYNKKDKHNRDNKKESHIIPLKEISYEDLEEDE
ncbi:MAG: hypothetical protein HY513_04905 [Candidatus Aenigmarchaeota archaeon]|nr:hypothetical protein [Candidatus Aenigmarchaeota archaeon]